MTKWERLASRVIKFVLWTAVILISIGMAWLVHRSVLMVWDAVFVGIVILAFAIAVSFGNSYGTSLDHVAKDSVLYEAIKLRTIMMHANFCWSVFHIAIIIAPLYCTCVVIYVSSFESVNDVKIQKAILLYSILSLVLTLAAYVIKAKGFSGAYRMASTILYKGIMERMCVESCNAAADLKLAEHMDQAEEVIKKFETEEGF